MQEASMAISPALAAHFTPPSESSGGAIALSVILAVAVVSGLVYMAQKKLRKRWRGKDGGSDRQDC
jgi:hypothetical protein